MTRVPVPANWRSIGCGRVEGVDVQYRKHCRTGMVVAESDDLPSLYVQGSSSDEVVRRLPAAILALSASA